MRFQPFRSQNIGTNQMMLVFSSLEQTKSVRMMTIEIFSVIEGYRNQIGAKSVRPFQMDPRLGT